MRRKILGVLLVTIGMFVGCGSNPQIPDDMTKEAYDYGKKAIEISQDYVDGKKTAASAYQEISDISNKCEKLDGENNFGDWKVANYVQHMQSDIKDEDSFSVVEDVNKMNWALTPEEEVKNLSDIIVGSWSFCHDSGWTMKMQFKANGTGSCDLCDESGVVKDSFTFGYSINDDNTIVSEYDDGSSSDWFRVSSITNKTFRYEMLAGKEVQRTGTAIKE